MLDYHTVKSWDFGDIKHTYSERDTMLYALGVGVGFDPMDAGQLRFVFENNLQVLPSMVAVLGTPGFWWRDPRTGADAVKLVHGEQRIRLFKPLPVAATLIAKNRVVSLTDKGAGKGAIAVIRREIYAPGDSEPLAETTQVTFLRGDGGFSESSGVSDPGPDVLPAVPDTKPDVEIDLPSLRTSCADLSVERRLQSFACRSRGRTESGLPTADLAWPVHVRHGNACGVEGVLQL